MAKLTIEIDAKWLNWIEARVGAEDFASYGDLIVAALEALDREEYEDKAMCASYGGGSIDDPEAIARGRARIAALIEEGENSGPPVPWNLEEFLATETARDARRKAA